MTRHWKRSIHTESSDDDISVELAVLRQHWKQILSIFQKSLIDQDDIGCVLSHFQHAITLLTDEVASQEQLGPILAYFNDEAILDTFFVWSLSCPEYAPELKYHQLRCFEFVLSRTQQELLFHKQIFKPLLNLLRSCESSLSIDLIEKHMIVVLNQVCVSITRTPKLLEFCFDISAEHGPSRFIIFSLLIPFVHRDGLADIPSVRGLTTGQQARDALLLIMQLSYRNEHIAKHIVENTNFCPILATGLSALYSDLPHHVPTSNDDWFVLTKKEWSECPQLVQFMNSLQFSNDVIQIAHPMIGQHLLQYIYHGFLVPVLGPSIHQNLHDVPSKISDLQHFSNTMDEVIAATAYLDLFLRSIHEPALLKVFLKFILCARIDEMSLLDTLIQRINYNTKLGLVSLGLFYTLINLNCEDIMYRLIFMYLIPCRHVMCSQRRHITDVEIYGKNAERFLSLRSSFSNSNSSNDQRYEYTFSAYLEDAHFSIVHCRAACRCWTAPYDGENPSPDTIIGETDPLSLSSSLSSLNLDSNLSTKSQLNPTYNMKSSAKNVTVSNDSGIHEDGLDSNSQLEIPPILIKSTDDFQLPSWLVNGEPIPEELLAKHANKSSQLWNDPMSDEEIDFHQPSAFYGFSFIDLSNNSEDTWSIRSSTMNTNIRDEMQTCVQTLNSCLDQFRNMNEQLIVEENLEEIARECLNEMIEQIPEQSKSIEIDMNLLNELLTKKLSFNEYLYLLDRIIDNNILNSSTKSAEQLSNEISHLGQEIEQYKIFLSRETFDSNEFTPHTQFLANTQSNYSVISFLQQSTSMDISQFVPNELTSQIQSTILTSTHQSKTAADIGPFLRTVFSKLENMLQNSLQVNLLLTGIIARLAHYSQPLLRSLLLNHSLVLETNVKSLFQILSNLKSKLESVSQTYNDFNSLVDLAQETLYERENPPKAHSIDTQDGKSVEQSQDEERVFFETRQSPSKDRSIKRNRILNFFRPRARLSDTNRESFLEKTSMKFINSREQTHVNNEWDDPKTRNIAFCAIVFNEFLKELAAITLEHSVQQFDDDQIFDDLSPISIML